MTKVPQFLTIVFRYIHRKDSEIKTKILILSTLAKIKTKIFDFDKEDGKIKTKTLLLSILTKKMV